jgi:hypothetical protein
MRFISLDITDVVSAILVLGGTKTTEGSRRGAKLLPVGNIKG